MDSPTLSVMEALAQLEEVAPNAPFLALGQTVFWDEPMKAGIALASRRLGYARRFVAGVHDTDYFAKLPSGQRRPGKFKSFPHNDTTTKGLWSAAGEFSTLFGSETVVTRERLMRGGLKLERIRRARPDILDEATEAWGWRGVVSMDDAPPVTAELPLPAVFQELNSVLNWAIEGTLSSLTGQSRVLGEELADQLRAKVCEAKEDGSNPTLSTFYRRLLPEFYDFAASTHVQIETTATTELLRFNRQTAHLPRFEILDRFLNPGTRDMAHQAYDGSIQGTGLYELSRFGTGSIPFDLVVPGKGRGTIRIGRRGLVIMTRKPLFASYKKPIESVADLANIIETRFGSECTLVGKAVTLIGMLAREFVFVFHEGASSYVKSSRQLHQNLGAVGHPLDLNPILRVRYHAWDALQVSCSWLHLPEPLQHPFGTEELCAPSFAQRWRQVSDEQNAIVEELGRMRRPIDLIRFLETHVGGAWDCLASEYESVHNQMEALRDKIDALTAERHACYAEIKSLRARRADLELKKGDHFRSFIFEKDASAVDLAKRAEFDSAIEDTIVQMEQVRAQTRDLMRQQRGIAQSPEVLKIHDRRRSIELEAELKRMRLIRHAIIASKGLGRASLRPSAWWFPLVCPDGLWYRETVNSAECYLEPLT